jgi:hypothetical protein
VTFDRRMNGGGRLMKVADMLRLVQKTIAETDNSELIKSIRRGLEG